MKPATILDQTLTVGDLIKLLQDYDDDLPVVLVHDYGDISHTQELLTITQARENHEFEERIYETAYSKSGLAIESYEDGDEQDDEDGDELHVLLLS